MRRRRGTLRNFSRFSEGRSMSRLRAIRGSGPIKGPDKPIISLTIRHIQMTGQLGYGIALAFIGDAAIHTAIVSLDDIGRPNTIGLAVWAIIIDTFYGECGSTLYGKPRGGAWSHLSQEHKKRVLPCIANSYPSSAIIAVVRMLGVITAAFHSLPDAVFRQMCQAMRCIARLHDFCVQAPTTLCASRIQTDTGKQNPCTAGAVTPPLCMAVGTIWPTFINGQSSKRGKSTKITKCGHDASLQAKRFMSGSQWVRPLKLTRPADLPDIGTSIALSAS